MTKKLSIAKRQNAIDLADAKSIFGDMDSTTIRSIGTAANVGASAIDAYSTITEERMRSDALGRQKAEVESRADTTAYALGKKRDNVLSEQEAAFANSGVAMEGSAMNVLNDTLHKAMEEQMLARSDADYKVMQLEVERVLSMKRAEYAAVDALFNIGTDIGLGFATGRSNAKNTSGKI